MKAITVILTLPCRHDVPAEVVDWMARDLAAHAYRHFGWSYHPPSEVRYTKTPLVEHEPVIIETAAGAWLVEHEPLIFDTEAGAWLFPEVDPEQLTPGDVALDRLSILESLRRRYYDACDAVIEERGPDVRQVIVEYFKEHPEHWRVCTEIILDTVTARISRDHKDPLRSTLVKPTDRPQYRRQ